MLLTSGVPGGAVIQHLPELSRDQRAEQFGAVGSDAPSSAVAGSYGTISFSYTLGGTSLPRGGRWRIAWRWPLDWQELQTNTPGDDAYLTATVAPATAQVEVSVAAGDRWSFNPWNHHIEVTVSEGELVQRDRVELICGDPSAGGRGWRFPTFTSKAARFLTAIDPDASNRWFQMTDPATVSLTPGPPARVVVVAPSEVAANTPFKTIVRVEDVWGNPTIIDSGEPRVEAIGARRRAAGQEAPALTEAVTSLASPPVYECRLVGTAGDGSFKVVASTPAGLNGVSNPVRILPAGREPTLFWGDLHSGQTEYGCGDGSLSDHFRFARAAAGLQFANQQANDHYVTTENWELIKDETEAAHEDGTFIAFYGCEWSALTPDGGDRNVIYRHREEPLHRSGRFYTERDEDPTPDLLTAPEFHRVMRNKEVICNLHAGGRPTNLNFHEPAIEPLAEVHSTHGTSEWFVTDALERGYRIGITAGADGVRGRPGADNPGWRQNRNVRSGLTAVYADRLDHDSLWEAFVTRRCYGTTGERIILWTEVDGVPMGGEIETSGCPQLSASIEGTAAIERVDVLRGTEVVHTSTPSPGTGSEIRVLWSGTEARGTARAQRVRWDGLLRFEDARVVGEVRSVGFQSVDDEIVRSDAQLIEWRSVTAGNRCGLILSVEGDGTATFATSPCRMTASVKEARSRFRQVEAGGLSRKVEFGPAPDESGSSKVELSWRDEETVAAGTYPYWVRVVQVDQSMAWSSPVYVTRS